MSEKLAIELFKAEIPIFGEFEFKLHERYPMAPKFLMKLNLREPLKGNLTNELAGKIGREFIKIARYDDVKYDSVVGLPHAGEPLAKVFVDNSWISANLLFLEKQDISLGKRRILPKIRGEFKDGDEVLIIDDVISLADTKIEAIDALRKNNLNVTNCVCLMDWELGGKEILADYDVNLKAVYAVSCLLSIWQRNKLLTKEQCTAIINQKDEIKEFIEKNQ